MSGAAAEGACLCANLYKMHTLYVVVDILAHKLAFPDLIGGCSHHLTSYTFNQELALP